MNRIVTMTTRWLAVSICLLGAGSGLIAAQTPSEDEAACRGLLGTRNLTLRVARLVEATETTPRYCYVKGLISPAIVYHVQLPLPRNWNGRFVNWGDGAKDGDLDFADQPRQR